MESHCVTRRKQHRPGIAKNDKNNGRKSLCDQEHILWSSTIQVVSTVGSPVSVCQLNFRRNRNETLLKRKLLQTFGLPNFVHALPRACFISSRVVHRTGKHFYTRSSRYGHAPGKEHVHHRISLFACSAPQSAALAVRCHQKSLLFMHRKLPLHVMVWYKMYWSSVVKPSKVQLGDHNVI